MREAFSYFSVLPVGHAGAPRAAALAWLPLVGAVVGGLAGGVAQLAGLAFGHAVGVATAYALSIVLTGAIHVDGFLDASDALGASVSPERRREILKDPHHGTFAIANFAALSAVWIAALAALDPAHLAIGMATAAAAARWSVLWTAFARVHASPGTLEVATVLRPPWPIVAAMTLLIFGLAYAGAPWATPAPLAGLLVLLAVPFARRRLGGGLSGDVYGAGIVCAEVLVLLALGAARHVHG